MKLMKNFILVLAVMLLCGTATAQAKSLRIRAATVVSPNHPWIIGLEFMAKELNKRSNGEINMSIHHSSVLGSDQTTIDEMRMGTIDIVVGGTTAVGSFIPEFQALSLPYLLNDYDAFERATAKDSPVLKFFRKAYKQHKLGITLLALAGGGLRNVSNNIKPINNPADLKGLKMRVPSNPLASKIWGAAGAIPSPLPWKEIYSALQTGVVDGFDSSVSGYLGSRYYEVAPYLSRTGHQFMFTHMSMSDLTWNRLSAKQQELILDVAAETSKVITKEARNGDELKIKLMAEKHGVKVNDVDVKAFVKLYTPIWKDLVKGIPNGGEVIRLMRSMN